MSQYTKTENGYLEIINPEIDFCSNYTIRIEELPRIRIKENINYSEWIIHLLKKTWVTSEMLYEIASKIRNYYPNNQIDWISTFKLVERKYYFDTEAKEANIKDFYESIKFNRSLASNQQIQDCISILVSQKLKKN